MRSTKYLDHQRRSAFATGSASSAMATFMKIRTANSPARISSSRHSIAAAGDRFGKSPEEIEALLAESEQKLLAARAGRVRPHLDDKELTSWNGLMISAFAKAGAILEEPRYSEAARRAADFVLARMYDPKSGLLLRRYRREDAAIPGFLDDYAFLTQGLLDLYESAFRLEDLETAIRLTEKQLALFEDKTAGGLFSTVEGDPNLIMRMKDDYDGAEPSGNAIAALNLLRLSENDGPRRFSRGPPPAFCGCSLHATRESTGGCAPAIGRI